MKKIGILLLVLFSGLLLVSCQDTKTPEETDTTAPVFLGLVGGKLSPLTHLQGVETDLLANIKAIDETDGTDVAISIVDFGGYEYTKFGEFTLTYQAKDKSGNKTTAERIVTSEEVLDVTLDVLIVGDEFIEIDYNNETAFTEVPVNGARFRMLDQVVQVMTVDFFEDQLEVHKEIWGDRGGYPIFPYASIVLVNYDGQAKYARFAAGAAMEVHADGSVHHTELPWDMQANGFANMLEDIEKHMPEGGYIVFAPSTNLNDTSQSTVGRIFLGKKLFNSSYVGGGMLKDTQDVEFDQVNLEIKLDHNVSIKKPDPIATPVLEIKRHVLVWDKVENALGYELYIDGEKQEGLITTLSYDLLENLEVREEEYTLELVAKSIDVFKYSDSLKTAAISYERYELKDQETPVLTYEDGVISWDASEGAEGYELYLSIGGVSKLIATTTETTFDANEALKGFEGNNIFYLIAVGNESHKDAKSANHIFKKDYLTEKMTIGNMTTTVVVMTANNYFMRRNATDGTKLENYIYKVTEVYEYDQSMTEAFSFIGLFDKDNNVQLLRNILTNQYTQEKGWHTDPSYTGNSAQLGGIDKYLTEGSYLLIGKNGLNVTFEEVDSGIEKIAAARDFLAYYFTKEWDDVTKTPASGGWRTSVESMNDAKEVEVIFE